MAGKNNGAPTARRVERIVRILERKSQLSVDAERLARNAVYKIILKLSPMEAYELLAKYVIPSGHDTLLPRFYFLLQHYAIFDPKTREDLDKLMIEIFKEILNRRYIDFGLLQDAEYALYSHTFWGYLERPEFYTDEEKPSGTFFRWLLSLGANDVKNTFALTKFQMAILTAADNRPDRTTWNEVVRDITPSLKVLRTQTPTEYITSLMTKLGRNSRLYAYFGEVVIKAYTRKPITIEVLRHLVATYMGRADTPPKDVDLVSVLRWYMAAPHLFRSVLPLLERLGSQGIDAVLDSAFIEWTVQNNFDLSDVIDINKAQLTILYRLPEYIRRLKVYAVTDWRPYSVVMTVLSKYGSLEQRKINVTYLIDKCTRYNYEDLQAKYIEALGELIDKFNEWPHNLQLVVAKAIEKGHHWECANLMLKAHIKQHNKIKPFIQELLTTEEGKECVNEVAFLQSLEDDDFDYIAFLNAL